MAHSVTLQLPNPLYTHFRDRADRTQRSVEAEILEVVSSAAAQEEALPSDLAEAVAGLELLDDAALWRAARSHLPAEAQQQLESLNLKQQDEGLSPAEADTLTTLLQQYDRSLLVRSHAARLLRQRGHEVSELVAAG